jgi:CRP-like cAMP-binding protein
MIFLGGVSLFADLDPEDLYDLSLFGEEETIAPPAVLCEEGDVEADDLFILLEGRVSVAYKSQKDDAEEAEREVAVLVAGDVVGEMSILDGSPRSATVRPKDGPIRVLRIPGQRFRSRLLSRSRVAQPLLVTLAQRIRNMSRRMADR